MPKIQIILPKTLDYLKNSPSELTSNAIKSRLDAIRSGSMLIFNKKRFGKKTVYTQNVDIGGAHRLIFEKVLVEGQEMLILRGVAFNHDYRKALSFESIGKIDKACLKNKGYDVCLEDIGKEVELEENLTVMVDNGKNWLEPTTFQSNIISSNSFPRLLSGPPGSGKTLVLQSLFQEQALQHQESEEGTCRLLYISGHETLVKNLKTIWNNWSQKELDDNGPEVRCEFLTPKELYKKNLSEASKEKEEISEEEILFIIRSLNNNKLKYSEIELKDEFLLASHILNNDLLNKQEFLNSKYKNIGVNQTLLYNNLEEPEKTNQREQIYNLYKNLIKKLNEDGKYYPGLSLLENVADNNKYDLVAIDEAQNIEVQNILNGFIYSKNNRVIISGDSYQKCKKKHSSIPLIEPALHNIGIFNVNESLFEKTLRLKPDVARTCDSLIKLEGALRKGRTDKTAYKNISFAAQMQEEKSLFWIENTANSNYSDLGKNATVAAIVLDIIDLEEAKKIIGSNNVFIADEAQGLELSKIFVYISKATQEKFYEINRLMQEYGIDKNVELQAQQNSPKNKGAVSEVYPEIISKLIVALSRSYGDVLMYMENADGNVEHKLKLFKPWLKKSCNQKEEEYNNEIELKQKLETIKESSSEEWLQVINDFINNDAIEQAEANLIGKLKLTKEQARKYMDHYNTKWKHLEIKEILKLVEDEIKKSDNKTEQPNDSNTKKVLTKQVSQKQEPSNAVVANDTNVRTNPKLLDEKLTGLVKLIISNFGVLNGALKLVKRDDFQEILFSLKLENGETLFVNLCLEQKIEAFFNKLLEEKNEQAKENIKKIFHGGFSEIENINDDLFNLCYWFTLKRYERQLKKYYFLKNLKGNQEYILNKISLSSLFDKSDEIIISILEFVFSNKDIKDIIIDWVLGSKEVLYFFLKNHYGVNSKVFVRKEFFVNKYFEYLSKARGEKIFSKIDNKYHPKDMTLFFVLSTHALGVRLINQYIITNNTLLNIAKNKWFIEIATDSKYQGGTPFYNLLNSRDGFKIFITKEHYFEDLINANQHSLFTKIKGNTDDRGSSIFSIFCRDITGIDFITRKFNLFKKTIKNNTSELFAKITGEGNSKGESPFYYLCANENGVDLLIQEWSFFKEIINQNRHELFAKVTGNGIYKGTSPFYWLFASEKGNRLIMSDISFFKDIIAENHHELFAKVKGEGPYKGKSPFFCLCSNQHGHDFMKKEWDFFKLILDENHNELFVKLTIEVPNRWKSPFYYLCASNSGCDLITYGWDFFKDIITTYQCELFGKISTPDFYGGLSPFYCLFANNNGLDLIIKEWRIFKNIIRGKIYTLFEKITIEGPCKGTAPFYYLCAYEEGCNLLIKEANFFKDIITCNEHELFKKATGEGPDKGTNPFYCLISNENGAKFVVNEWEFFKPIIIRNYYKLFSKVVGENDDMGRSVFSVLLENQKIIELILNDWDDFKPIFESSNNNLFQEVIKNLFYMPETYLVEIFMKSEKIRDAVLEVAKSRQAKYLDRTKVSYFHQQSDNKENIDVNYLIRLLENIKDDKTLSALRK